jgi:hypothetical protein
MNKAVKSESPNWRFVNPIMMVDQKMNLEIVLHDC